MTLTEKEQRERDWLVQKYEVEQVSAVKLAKMCGVSYKTVTRRMDYYGIERRQPGRPVKDLFQAFTARGSA